MNVTDPIPLIFGVPDEKFYSRFHAGQIFVSELRPGLEGTRLVASRLLDAGVLPVVICDNMMAWCMKQGLVSETHLFSFEKLQHAALCRTGSLIAALAARKHGVPVFLSRASVHRPRAASLLKLGKKRILKKTLTTYAPLWEEVPLALIAQGASPVHEENHGSF